MAGSALGAQEGEGAGGQLLQQLGGEVHGIKGLVGGVGDAQDMAADAYPPPAQDLAADGPGEHQGGGESAAEMAAAPHVVIPAVPDVAGEIGVAGAGEDLEILIVPRTLVLVADDHGQGGAGGAAVQGAGQDSGDIALQASGGGFVPAGGAAGHLDADFLHVQRLPGGQAVQNAADGFAVALPENGEAHPVTDGR